MKTIANDRRNFLKMVALGTGTLVTFSFSNKVLAKDSLGFGNDIEPVPPADPVCPPVKPDPALTSAISKNHGHALALSLAELKANGAKMYSIQGTSGHPHTVDITNEVLLALLIHNVVEVETTKDAGHTHVVTLTIV